LIVAFRGGDSRVSGFLGGFRSLVGNQGGIDNRARLQKANEYKADIEPEAVAVVPVVARQFAIISLLIFGGLGCAFAVIKQLNRNRKTLGAALLWGGSLSVLGGWGCYGWAALR
jgi:hypothetical protein